MHTAARADAARETAAPSASIYTTVRSVATARARGHTRRSPGAVCGTQTHVKLCVIPASGTTLAGATNTPRTRPSRRRVRWIRISEMAPQHWTRRACRASAVRVGTRHKTALSHTTASACRVESARSTCSLARDVSNSVRLDACISAVVCVKRAHTCVRPVNTSHTTEAVAQTVGIVRTCHPHTAFGSRVARRK